MKPDSPLWKATNNLSTLCQATLDYYALGVANFSMCTYIVTALSNATGIPLI